jgi:hypothetical protein
MVRNGARLCDVCENLIPFNAAYRLGTLSPQAAAGLLEVDDARLVPTWTQVPDGTVELDICLECFGLMDDPFSTIEVCDGASGVVH